MPNVLNGLMETKITKIVEVDLLLLIIMKQFDMRLKKMIIFLVLFLQLPVLLEIVIMKIGKDVIKKTFMDKFYMKIMKFLLNMMKKEEKLFLLS